jgi:hypothetical protein
MYIFKHLEKKRKILQDHLISLKFSMEDRKLAREIIKGKIQALKVELQNLMKQQLWVLD